MFNPLPPLTRRPQMRRRMNRDNKKLLILKHSCLTGRVVWAYRCDTEEAARRAYYRACKKEVRRIRQWSAKMAERKRKRAMIFNGSNSSSSGINVNKYKDPAVRRLARQMCKLIKDQPPKDTTFYDHIVEEAKRRNWQSKRWVKERDQMIRYGKTHIKSEYQPKKKNISGS